MAFTAESSVFLVNETTSSTYNFTTAEPERGGASATFSPGHQAIMEMHASSQSNAIAYVAVVLILYAMGMSIVIIKYMRHERYESGIIRLFQDMMQRDSFFRNSGRRTSLPKCTFAPSTVIDDDDGGDDTPQSPTSQNNEIGQLHMESKL